MKYGLTIGNGWTQWETHNAPPMNNQTPTPVRAIKVKYLSPTNHRGSRHKAELVGKDWNMSLTDSFNYALNDGGREKVAVALLNKIKGTKGFEDWKTCELSQVFSLNADETIFTFTL